MKIRICILSSVHQALDSRIFYKQAISLAKAGYDVTVIAEHAEDDIISSVRILALAGTKNRLWRIMSTWKLFILALKQRAEIYHLHDPELLIVGSILKFMTKSIILYDVHEDYPEIIMTKTWIPKHLRRITSTIFNIFEKNISKLFDGVITATDHILAKFKGVNAISVKNYPILDNTSAVAERKNNLTDEYVLIFAGGLGRQYYTKEIIQSLGLINSKYNISLRLLGRFEDKSFEREIMDLPEFSRVKFLGWCTRDEVVNNLKEADIGLALDRFEMAISTKLLEYMAIGIPVIASDHVNRKNIVEGNGCGMTVDASNPESIAKVIEYLLANPELMRKMGENGRHAVTTTYNWGLEELKLLNFYNRLLIRGQLHCAE